MSGPPKKKPKYIQQCTLPYVIEQWSCHMDNSEMRCTRTCEQLPMQYIWTVAQFSACWRYAWKKSSRLFTNKPGVHISPLQGVISISRLHSCQGCAACPRWTRCLWKFKVVKRYASKVEMLRNNQTRKVFCNRVMVTPPDAQACFKRSKANIELRWHGNSPGSQLSQPFKQSVRSVRLKLQRFQRMNNSHGCDRDADWRPWCRVATMFTSKTWGTHPKADLDEPVIING